MKISDAGRDSRRVGDHNRQAQDRPSGVLRRRLWGEYSGAIRHDSPQSMSRRGSSTSHGERGLARTNPKRENFQYFTELSSR